MKTILVSILLATVLLGCQDSITSLKGGGDPDTDPLIYRGADPDGVGVDFQVWQGEWVSASQVNLSDLPDDTPVRLLIPEEQGIRIEETTWGAIKAGYGA